LGGTFSELERCAGMQFDPKIVRLFVELIRGNPAFVYEKPERKDKKNGVNCWIFSAN